MLAKIKQSILYELLLYLAVVTVIFAFITISTTNNAVQVNKATLDIKNRFYPVLEKAETLQIIVKDVKDGFLILLNKKMNIILKL